jgi:hypothetical protein
MIMEAKRKVRKSRETKVLRLMRERGASQTAIDAYLKERDEVPPRTINEVCYRGEQLVDWNQYEVNEIYACVSVLEKDFWGR